MSRSKLILLGLLAVFVASSAMAVSASAAEPLTRYQVEGSEITESKEIDAVVGVAQLNGKVGGIKIMIECTQNGLVKGAKNQIQALGQSDGEIEYRQCYLFTIEKGKHTILNSCSIKEPIKFAYRDQLFVGPGGLVEDDFWPNEGTTFVEIKIEGGGCALIGNFKAEENEEAKAGKRQPYTASMGDEAERELTEHELVFTSQGSNIIFGNEPASFTNTISRIKIVKGQPGWYVN